MPRTTRKGPSLHPRKAPLLFVEAPLNGAKHRYAPEGPRPANPRALTLEEHRESRSARTTWVTPQFDATAQLPVPGRRGGRGKPSHSGRSVLDRNSSLALAHLKKTSACKFPALSFESGASSPRQHVRPAPTRVSQDPRPGTGVPDRQRVSGCAREAASPGNRSGGDAETPKRLNGLWSSRKRERGARPVTSPAEENSTVVPVATVANGANICPMRTVTPLAARGYNFCAMDSVFSPPSIQTPQTQRNTVGTKLSPSFRLQPPLTEPQVTPENQTYDILADDTPEEDYGVKVTWRRRKRLMKFLIEQGQLTQTDIAINF